MEEGEEEEEEAEEAAPRRKARARSWEAIGLGAVGFVDAVGVVGE